jgi:hypothetical protein
MPWHSNVPNESSAMLVPPLSSHSSPYQEHVGSAESQFLVESQAKTFSCRHIISLHQTLNVLGEERSSIVLG